MGLPAKTDRHGITRIAGMFCNMAGNKNAGLIPGALNYAPVRSFSGDNTAVSPEEHVSARMFSPPQTKTGK
jgi:hypothetical protein